MIKVAVYDEGMEGVKWRAYEAVSVKVRAFHKSKAKYRLLVSGKGAGKTYAICAEGMKQALERAGSTGLITRRIGRDLARTTRMTLMTRFNLEELGVRWNDDDEVLTFPNASKIYLFGAEDTKAMLRDKLRKLQSLELDWFAVDQAEDFTPELWMSLKGTLRGVVGPRRGWAALNPVGTLWLRSEFTKGVDHEVFHISSYENPYLPKEYVKDLATAYQGRMAKAYVDGQWVELSGLVWPEFGVEHELSIEYDAELPVIRSWDFGFKRPAVTFWQNAHDYSRIGRDADRRAPYWRLLAEHEGKDEGIIDYAKRVIDYGDDLFGVGVKYRDVGDPTKHYKDGNKTEVDLLSTIGIYVSTMRMPKRGRIELIRYALGRDERANLPRLVVHPRCSRVIDAFTQGCVWDQRTELPVEDDDFEHLVDSMTFFAAWEIEPYTVGFDRKDWFGRKAYISSVQERELDLEAKRVIPSCEIPIGRIMMRYKQELADYTEQLEYNDSRIDLDEPRLHLYDEEDGEIWYV